MKFYRCEHCGNVITHFVDSGVPVVCCGEPMKELTANTTDAAVEKHVPVVKVEDNKVTVSVGSVEHPMTEAHYITLIVLETKNGTQFKQLTPSDKPEAVFYIGEDDKYHEAAKKYMPRGTCGVMCFGLKGDKKEAVTFMDHLQLINIVTHVADAKTCILHPASHTHRQMTDEQLKEAGVDPTLIRLSIGLENPDDLIKDIEEALKY